MNERYERLLRYFSPDLRIVLSKIGDKSQGMIEEIRIRRGKPLIVRYEGNSYFVTGDGWISSTSRGGFFPSDNDMRITMDLLTESSAYAMQEQLSKGFITCHEGHRVGIAGTAVIENGHLVHLKQVNALNFRIAHEVTGVADALVKWLVAEQTLPNILIVSPPGYGKTTLLRDLARQLSSRYNVGLADERGEIAACREGMPTFDVGFQTDVFDMCPKAEAMQILLRTMSPQIVITDEIGSVEDLVALRETAACGVKVIATAHGASIEELKSRPVMNEMLLENLFDCFVLLQPTRGKYEIFPKGVRLCS